MSTYHVWIYDIYNVTYRVFSVGVGNDRLQLLDTLDFEINEVLGKRILNMFFLRFIPDIDVVDENPLYELHCIVTSTRNVRYAVFHVYVTHSRLNWTVWPSWCNVPYTLR
jgi:hypothetical protein